MKKVEKRGIFMCIAILFSGIFLSGIGSATQSAWHKPIPCVGCHLDDIDNGADEWCGKCHNYGLNVEKLQNEHTPKICKKCHIGNTIINGTVKEIFHNGHSAVNCTTCHSEDNFTVIKIQNKNLECVSCHGNKIHGIHIKNIGNTCVICHGSWTDGKVYARSVPQTINETRSIRELEKFTIFNFMKRLFLIFADK